MNQKNFYINAHLIVAAIRILEYQNGKPPTMDDISRTLNISIEECNQLCRKLNELHIVELIEKTGDIRAFIKDHLKIEEIPKQPEQPGIESELLKFKQSRKEHLKKIDAIKAEQAEKKKKLHAELEEKLKNVLKK